MYTHPPYSYHNAYPHTSAPAIAPFQPRQNPDATSSHHLNHSHTNHAAYGGGYSPYTHSNESFTGVVASGSDSTPTVSIPATTIPFSSYKLPEQYPDYEENGRLYHGYRRGVYPFPCDEQEKDRLDLFHKVLTEARAGDGLLYSPLPPSPRILDLGCGTGFWAIDIANKYKDATVVGIDLSRIQPENRPPNCDFYAPKDFEAPWALGEDSWDLIHMQMGTGSVASWPSLYRRIYAHLRPGAWFEQVEIDFEPRVQNKSLTETAWYRWYMLLKEATEQTMRPIAHSVRQTMADLKATGFVEVDHQMVGLPLGTWVSDVHEKEVGRWYSLALSESLETMSLAPFSRVLKWHPDQIRAFVREVKAETLSKDIQGFNLLHIYRARKPPENA
ncbi:hypothetical protein VTN31DRAFT_1144 [Thermomyces dupontii]|uniref:uncharacterized protein n=1 Tax=Talaromyces thermophilus TaxID=28565 RepID=UPI003743B244